MIPYGQLTGSGQTSGMRFVEVPEEHLHALLRAMLAHVAVDEAWYLRTNPDVDAAVKAGTVSSARDHYISFGYFEDRLPRPVIVNEKWYQHEYPDVAEAVRRGDVFSGQHHFLKSGFKEGRLPYAGWTLTGTDDAGKAAA